jgi:DNA-binding MarR family transcriptional regulator
MTTGRTDAGDQFSLLAILIIRLNGLLTAAGDRIAKPAGQTSARWQVLAAIEDGPATVADIARVLGLARQSVQRVADVLADDGLVVYEDNPRHRRAKLLRLTPPGRQALVEIQTAQREWADAIATNLPVAEVRRANALLERVLALLSAPVREKPDRARAARSGSSPQSSRPARSP